MKRREARTVLALASALVLAVGAAACTGKGSANWNTAPTRDTHVRFFPIDAASAHATVDCNECHGAFDTFKKFDCVTCHTAAKTDPLHAGVTGYANDSVACYGCHKDGTGSIDPAVHATYFPLAHGAPAGTKNACSSCHANLADKTQLDCSTCHAHDQATSTPAHASVAKWTFSGATCAVCHDAAAVKTIAAHAQFPIAAGAAHATSGCLECHPNRRQDKPWTQDFTAFSCTGCHTDADTTPRHASVANYQYLSSACYGCHKDGQGGIDPAVHTRSYFPIAAGTTHATAGCSQCHVSASDRKVIDCTTCHEHAAATTPGQHGAVGGFTAAGAGCIVCHADGQVDRVSAHTQFAISAGSRHYRSACLQCHTQKRADKAWAQDFSIPDCTVCHTQSQMDPRHAGRSGYTYATSACLRCHPNGSGGD